MRKTSSDDARDRWAAGSTSPGVRRVSLDGGGTVLSGLLAEPATSPPRAVVVALHGAGMTARYFDGQSHPDLSLLALAPRLGVTVLALDRPGYGRSAAALPDGQPLREQVECVRSAITSFTCSAESGAGVLLLGHSFGGKLALSLAADPAPWPLIGLDVSGCGHRHSDVANELRQLPGTRQRLLNWGPSHLYPPGVFQASRGVVAPVPSRETEGAAHWTRRSSSLLPRISVPVRLTFAQHEAWWRHADADLAELAGLLTAAPRVVLERLPNAGHNISLGWAARPYHLRVLAFLDEVLGDRERAVERGRGPAATRA
ncbi:alpha/beta hydrolase [Streptomyces sp. NPDC006516]|uniref:alpha/beta hydrolase n=1 Tax=Streptomyces sp. NPDC006516 TaxID=3154309 RepID=UPI0033BB4004